MCVCACCGCKWYVCMVCVPIVYAYCASIYMCKSYRVCVCMLCVHGVGTPDTCVYIPLCVCACMGTPGAVCAWYVHLVCVHVCAWSVCAWCVCVCLACVPSVPVCTHMCACACPAPHRPSVSQPLPLSLPEVIPKPRQGIIDPYCQVPLHPPSWQICCMPFLLWEIMDIKLKSGLPSG